MIHAGEKIKPSSRTWIKGFPPFASILRVALLRVRVYYAPMRLPGKYGTQAVGAAMTMLGIVWMLGCAQSYESETSAPSSTVPPSTTLSAARMAAKDVPGASLGQGIGDSMQPLYGNNTIFLIAPIKFEDLRPGMNVAYRSPQGKQIVHTLQYKEIGGWVIEGENQPHADIYRVTAENLVGVVYGSFQSSEPAKN